MSKLEVLGALFAKSVAGTEYDRHTELMRLVEEAKDEISEELEEKQYALWESLGKPTFEVEGKQP